jgi:AbrB family looped-hinge helix DNA binding protein
MKVSEKGQITIPKAIRDQLKLEPGDEVEFRRTDEGFVLRRQSDETFPENGVRADDPIASNTEVALELTRGSLE